MVRRPRHLSTAFSTLFWRRRELNYVINNYSLLIFAKGRAIKQLTDNFDSRSYVVNGFAALKEEEKPIIIFGVSGKSCQKQEKLVFLTAVGMVEYW